MELLVIGICVVVWLLMVTTGRVANRFGRNEFGWAVTPLFFGFLPIIVLAILGDTEEKQKQKILKEEELRQSVAQKYAATQKSID